MGIKVDYWIDKTDKKRNLRKMSTLYESTFNIIAQQTDLREVVRPTKKGMTYLETDQYTKIRMQAFCF